jgi:hypothetical protein
MAALVLGSVLVSCAAPPTVPQTPNPYVVGGRQQGMPPGGSTAADPPIPSPAGPQRPGNTRPVPAEPSPGSLAYLDFKNGFRDLTFGDPPTSNMVLKEEHGDDKFYTRPQDDLTLGGSQLQRIIYGFYKDRFYWLLLETKGLVNSHAMLDVIRQTYGPGYQGNRYIQRFGWLGSRVSGIYTENAVTSDARMSLSSNSISAEKAADEKNKARKGVGNM